MSWMAADQLGIGDVKGKVAEGEPNVVWLVQQRVRRHASRLADEQRAQFRNCGGLEWSTQRVALSEPDLLRHWRSTYGRASQGGPVR